MMIQGRASKRRAAVNWGEGGRWLHGLHLRPELLLDAGLLLTRVLNADDLSLGSSCGRNLLLDVLLVA
eukprot:802709-Heterocapsa_arctica.AAC.1